MHDDTIALNIPSDCAALFDKTARSYLELEEGSSGPERPLEEARALVARLDRGDAVETTLRVAWEVLGSCLDQATEEVRGGNDFQGEADLVKLEGSINRVRYFAREWVRLNTLWVPDATPAN